MDNQPKTSFIPKKPVQTSTPGEVKMVRSKKTKGRAVVSIISTLIFVATLVALGASYFYKFTLEKKIESQVESLRTTKQEFDEKFIQDAN